MPKKPAQLDREIAEALGRSTSYSPQAAKKIIKATYGTLDPYEVYLEATSKRAGTAHKEWQERSGTVRCGVCGIVEEPTADPAFHPEQYIG